MGESCPPHTRHSQCPVMSEGSYSQRFRTSLSTRLLHKAAFLAQGSPFRNLFNWAIWQMPSSGLCRDLYIGERREMLKTLLWLSTCPLLALLSSPLPASRFIKLRQCLFRFPPPPPQWDDHHICADSSYQQVSHSIWGHGTGRFWCFLQFNLFLYYCSNWLRTSLLLSFWLVVSVAHSDSWQFNSTRLS